MDAPKSYPLVWPSNWRRTRPDRRQRAKFRKETSRRSDSGTAYTTVAAVSVAAAFERLSRELDRLGAGRIVVSTNLTLRIDGAPRSGQPEPHDPGVACYFRMGDKPVVLAADKWDRVADNIVAIAKHIEAMRGQDRWGVGSLDQAFGGYLQLSAPGRPWWEALELRGQAVDLEDAERAYRRLAKVHSDDHDRMVELNGAIAAARTEFAQPRVA